MRTTSADNWSPDASARILLVKDSPVDLVYLVCRNGYCWLMGLCRTVDNEFLFFLCLGDKVLLCVNVQPKQDENQERPDDTESGFHFHLPKRPCFRISRPSDG